MNANQHPTDAMTRRSALVAGLALGALVTWGATPARADTEPSIDQRIEELQQRHNAQIGLYAVDLGTGRTISHLDDTPFAMCSTFKGYAAARVLQMAGRGELSLDEPVFIDPAAVVANSPITEPKAGGTLTLAELCQAALQRSDNTAGNLLLRAIGGPPAITEFARSIGDNNTRLDRWEVELNTAIPGDPRDTSTPRALGTGYRELLTGNVLGAPQRQQFEDWLRGNTTSSVRPGLPPGWTSADKTGAGDYGSTNDVGIVYGPAGERLLLAVMTRSRADDPGADNLRPLITELTTFTVPWLISRDGSRP